MAVELDADPKERAELAMIIDVERNDLGRVCANATVRLVNDPHVVTHRTVHHREATIAGIVREGRHPVRRCWRRWCRAAA